MNYLILIIVGVAGIILGAYLARCRKSGLIAKSLNCVRDRQSRKKAKNKEKILQFFQENQKVANNDIEKLLNVSDATATRYLDELEKEGRIRQVGTTGRHVYYEKI